MDMHGCVPMGMGARWPSLKGEKERQTEPLQVGLPNKQP